MISKYLSFPFVTIALMSRIRYKSRMYKGEMEIFGMAENHNWEIVGN